MASRKQRSKLKSLDRRARQALQPPRPHRDGDRRRKNLGITVREALAAKAAMQRFDLDAPPFPDLGTAAGPVDFEQTQKSG